MKLFESAWDGDVEFVRSVLMMGVPVNVARPVRISKHSCIQCTVK